MGGERSDGRWHTAARGKRIVYLAEHPAAALIEVLANLRGNPALFPDMYRLMKIEVADNASIEVLAPNVLSDNWREYLFETQAIGDNWLRRGQTALLVVPSVPSPESQNYLFNPLHAHAPSLIRAWCKNLQYDKRLFHVR